LDSSRLRSLIAKSMDLDPNNVHGYVIGEHGDSSIAAWSSVRIGALPLLDNNRDDDEPINNPMHVAMHREVVNAAGDVIALKGYTNWAIGTYIHTCVSLYVYPSSFLILFVFLHNVAIIAQV